MQQKGHTSMENHWVSLTSYIVSWEGRLPQIHISQRLDWCVALVKELLAAGEAYQVWTLSKTPDHKDLKGYNGSTSYIDYLVHRAKQTGYFHILPPYPFSEEDIASSNYVAYSHVAYYDKQGNITTDNISNIGYLRASLATRFYRVLMWPQSPIIIDGAIVDLKRDDDDPESYADLVISLGTDIWFPEVADYANLMRNHEKFVSNHELSAYHTKRFNSFLASVRNSILAAGGKWYFEVPDKMYRHLVTANGIVLPGTP
jgi:hypothetical protein